MRDLPGSGTEPRSPALAGGFFTTEPLGKHRVGSKSNDKCCCKRYSEERHMEGRGESLLRVKAETGVMWPQAEEHLESPEAGRSKDSPLEPSREAALPTP